MAKFARAGRVKPGIICFPFRKRPPRLYVYYLLLGVCCLWTVITGFRTIQDVFLDDWYSCPPALEEVADPQRSICFVTSIFGQDLTRADKPSNVRDLIDCSRYRFFLFTNLRGLHAPGWTKIVKQDLPYQRMITQSRWGKFLAWQEPQVRHSCRIVFYMDGYVKPQLLDSTVKKFEGLARNLTRKGTVGLAQVLHPNFQGLSVEEIFQGILLRNKDVPENTNVTVKWLQSQPDYETHIPYYLNKYFGKKDILLCPTTFLVRKRWLEMLWCTPTVQDIAFSSKINAFRLLPSLFILYSL
jgi:hypothetical protein